jgi:hypothetical protein
VVRFGAGLHVRGEGLDAGALRAVLASHGATDVSIEPIDPTLEDVFLAVAGAGADMGAGAGAAP